MKTPQTQRARLSGSHGFNEFSDFAMAVRNAASIGGETDGRLLAAAASTYGSEGSGTDGGFAIPPDFRTAIMDKAFNEDSLLARTDQQVVTGNSLTAPSDSSTQWGSGGITSFWTNEAVAATQSTPELEDITVRLDKLTVVVPVTQELLEDAPALQGYLTRKAASKIDFRVSDAIVNGTGAGQPLGFMKSPALIAQAKESGQTADTIEAANVTAMLGRMPPESRRNAVWLIHPDAENQLPLMVIGHQPVYQPPSGLRDSPFGTLLSIPVIPHQACQTLGDLGDIALADLSQYLTVLKTGGMKVQSSIHLWFDRSITAFRFDLRIAGQPWWSGAITAKNGSFTQSPFITLAERT